MYPKKYFLPNNENSLFRKIPLEKGLSPNIEKYQGMQITLRATH